MVSSTRSAPFHHSDKLVFFRWERSTIDTRTAQITNTRLAVHEWVSRHQSASQEH